MPGIIVTGAQEPRGMLMNQLKGIGQFILIPLLAGYLAGFTANAHGRICKKTLGSRHILAKG